MFAMILPFVLLTFLGVMTALGLDLSPQGGGSPVSQPGVASSPQTENFVATAHATLAFGEANPGYTGTITAAQLQPYMGNTAYPSQWAAEEQNGLLYLWSGSLPAGAISGIGTETQTDCAYAQVINGLAGGSLAGGSQMQSECGLALGAAPSGVPNGAVIYVIESPV